NAYTEPRANAYRMLYLIAKKQGDLAEALAWHEKYMAADKGYLDEVSANALAYQTVQQQVLRKKSQVDALAKQNRILELQQELDHKAMVTSRLYILLLLLSLAFIVLWSFRLKRSQLSFKRQARRDGLTGIYNRQHFLREAERELLRCAKSAREASLVLIDLDQFKRLNDTFGHTVGDRVLQHAVQACQPHLRSTDVFGRLGGEEFGILLPECTLDQIDERVEHLRLAIASAARDDALGVAVTASFGVAVTVRSGCDLRQLLVHADDALYEAKSTGRNRAVVFDPAHGAHMERMRKSRVSMPAAEQGA
ncbi:MAG: GGDEF domain-containing protein, partial [Rhodanobacter sp.]|nr:GGDEF domain-containing protein [Rhodanobacter sp.]